MQCAYCEKPLLCDACQAPFVPADPDLYQALSMGEQPILCPACGQILICHWCKFPYDGQSASEESND